MSAASAARNASAKIVSRRFAACCAQTPMPTVWLASRLEAGHRHDRFWYSRRMLEEITVKVAADRRASRRQLRRRRHSPVARRRLRDDATQKHERRRAIGIRRRGERGGRHLPRSGGYRRSRLASSIGARPRHGASRPRRYRRRRILTSPRRHRVMPSGGWIFKPAIHGCSSAIRLLVRARRRRGRGALTAGIVYRHSFYA